MNRLFALLFGALAASFAGATHAEPPIRILVFADRDDDDANGVADGEQAKLGHGADEDVRWLTPEERSIDRGRSTLLTQSVRWVADGRAVPVGQAVPARAAKLGLQGLSPGRSRVMIGARAFDVSVIELMAQDVHGTSVDLARSHASISRVLPAFLANDDAGASDQDALRWIVIGEADSLPSYVEITSLGPSGRELDALSRVELWELPCPAIVENAARQAAAAKEPDPRALTCRGTPLIRATVDRIDRTHPESSGRSLRAEVGGKLVVRVGGRKAASIRVGGPRGTTLGDIERFRGRLRVHVLRTTPGGAPAVGDSPASALALVRSEIDTANLLWGQCGIHFGTTDQLWIHLADPPPSYLIAVGCGLGLPASGGELRFRAGKQRIQVHTREGDTPLAVAMRLVDALRARGLGAVISRNPRIEPGALETMDVLVRQGDALAQLDRDGDFPTSSDPSLSVCIGSVDLADGLSHFTDHDSAAGTLEERTLVKAYADRDPQTIEVFVIPAFSGAGRVGESFLDAEGSGVHNTVIVDRAAIRAGARSHVLSHELGHVLLDMPGHPDDYGVDQPSALMDADATDPTIFGPRRLSVAECERAVRQRGPGAPAPLLELWPLFNRGR